MVSLLLVVAALQAPQPLTVDVRELPHLGVTVREQRTLDALTGRIHRRAVDGAGREVDVDASVRAEIAARDAAESRIAPLLAAALAGGGEVQVGFWLRRPAGMPDLRAVLDAAHGRGMSAENARRQALRVAEEFTAAGNGAFAEAARALGLGVALADRLTPLVFVDVPAGRAAAVRQLALRADVDRAYLSSTQWFDETVVPFAPTPNDIASPSARTDHVHRLGVTGQGVKVLMNDTAPVVIGNPYLPTVVQGRTGSAASHATAVAGMISSTHAQYHGAAPGLGTIYDWGQAGDAGAPLAWSWGMQQGISFGNCSWWNGQKGQINMLDRYFDYIIRNFGVMLFKSIGNQGSGDGLTTTPGNGYNVTGSGCADDRSTKDWKDDLIASFSSWVNPAEGHDKPEVSAHGTGITSTTTGSPWIGSAGSGTSYASPVTCGVAALLAATDNSLLAKPEVVRAALMAGAWNNIEGAAAMSDRDGAGAIDAAASQSAIARGQYVAATLTPQSFQNGIWSRSIALVAGDETRVVALWFSHADSSYTTDVLQMDLDMVVRDPFGLVVASSASTRNAFEILQFTPQTTGTYTVELQQQRFQAAQEVLALCWNTRRNAATDVVSVAGTVAIGQPMTVDFFDPYHPGQTYAGLMSLTGPPATLRVGPNKVLDLGYDALVALSLGLPGFVGTLPANGRASVTFGVPNDTALRNLTLHLSMVTVAPQLPELFEDTAATTSVTVQ